MEEKVINYFQSKEKVTKILSYLLFVPIVAPFIIQIVGNKNAFLWFSMIFFPGLMALVVSFLYVSFNKIKITSILKKNKALVFFALFLIATIISCVLTKNKFMTFFGDYYRREGLMTYIAYIGYFIAGIFIKDGKRHYNLFVIVALILSTVALINMQLFNPLHIKAVFYNSNHFGYYLVIATTLSLIMFMQEKGLENKLYYLLTFIITTTTLILNNTFGSYLALLAGFIVAVIYYFKKYNKLILIPMLIFIILSLISNRNGTNIVLNNFHLLNNDVSNIVSNVDTDLVGSRRGILWKTSVEMIKKKPLLGYGLDNLSVVYFDHKCYVSDRPHNIILYMILSSGIVGAFCYFTGYFMILFKPFMKFLKNKKISKEEEILFFVIGSYFVSSLFGNTMFYTTPYIVIFLGMLFKK